MSMLSSRQVSISDHVKRRRSSAALNNYANGSAGAGGSCSSGGSGNGGIHPQHHAQHQHAQHRIPIPSSSSRERTIRRHLQRQREDSGSEDEGGYDSRANSYGNYDAPSHYCRSYGTSDHGSYAAESYIGGYNNNGNGNGNGNGNSTSPSSSNAVSGRMQSGVSPNRQRYSDPITDIMEEGQRGGMSSLGEHGRHRGNDPRRPLPPRRVNGKDYAYDPALRLSQASTIPMGPHAPQEPLWEDETLPPPSVSSSMMYSSYPKNVGEDSSYCPSAATVSTTSTSGSSSSGHTSSTSGSGWSFGDEDAIRQGIIDISTLIATYIAGALSFLIGIFLTLTSPLVKMVKVIVGDVRGLFGELAFLRELGSLWRMYRELRRRSAASTSPSSSGEHNNNNSNYRHQQQQQHHRQHDRYRYDDESTEATRSTVYTENSPQFVGGWQPRMSPPSVGSNTNSTGSSPNNPSTAGSNNYWMANPNLQRQQQHQPHRSTSALPLVYEDQYRDNAGQVVHQQQQQQQQQQHNNTGQHRGGGNPNAYYPQPAAQQHSRQLPSPPSMPQYDQAYRTSHPSSPPKKQVVRPMHSASAHRNRPMPPRSRSSV